MLHTISALVENHFGVLTRVAGLFASRGYNIQSLTVGPTEDETVSRMTIVVEGDDKIIDQVKKQLNKLIDTIKVIDLTGEDFVDRELVLIKVTASSKTRPDILQLTEVFKGSVVDIAPAVVTLQVSGNPKKIDAFITMLKPYGVKEMARTGRIALGRG
jgi:acetolactate synthase-1/3 small subunit